MADNTLFSLTNGTSTGWLDTKNLAAVLMTLKFTGTATITLYDANDSTQTTKSDEVARSTTYTSSGSTELIAPFAHFLKVAQTAGSGSVIVSFGPAYTIDGDERELIVQGRTGTPTGNP